jgi:hypothetical protein
MRKYVVHSKKEQGFWNNNIGWVFTIGRAAKYKESESIPSIKPFLAGVPDAEWLCVDYRD